MAEEKKVRRRRPEGAQAGSYQVVGFPKEFERSFMDSFDPTFYAILGGTLLLAIIFIGIQNFRDHTVSEEQLAAIRQEALRKLYGVELQLEEEPEVTESQEDEGAGVAEEEAPTEQEQAREERRQQDEGKEKEVRRASAQERAATRQAQAQARAAARAAAEAQVASQGVLGLLTAAGGGGEGEAVVDILGGDAGSGTGDLSGVLENVGGLAVAQSQGQRTRVTKGGGRVTTGAGIDELVEGIGTAQTGQLSRKGAISIAGPASVAGRGSKASNRKPDVITKVIQKHQAAVDFCYQKVAKINPNLKGEVTVQFAITPEGRTTGAKVVQSTLRSSEVERCIIQRIRGWADFPKIDRKEGDVTVRQKYVFGG